MFERIKDLMYDLSDILLSLVLIALIFSVVSWKISDSLAFEVTIPEKNQAEATDINLPADDNAETLVLDDIATQEGENNDAPEAPVTNPNNENTTAQPATSVDASTTDAKPSGTQVNLVGASKSIEIKSGSSGWTIGKLLAEEGFVSDTQTFIKRVEELGLGSKLRSGEFTLSTDMSLDEIIYKISGQ